MKTVLICLVVVVAAVAALPTRIKRGHIEHEDHHGHGHATSYQNFNLESYHPVPVYKKHEPEHHEHGHLALTVGDAHGLGHDDHEAYGYHQAALTDGAEHGEEGYAHLGAAAAVSEDTELGYEGHGSY